MANFDKLAEQGKPFFLRCDQRTILRRFPGLEADAGHLYPRFCGERFAVDRETGDVTGPDGQKAGPAETLAIFDWLCHQDAPVRLAGEWRTTNNLPGCGQSNPDDAKLNGVWGARFSGKLPELRRACAALGGAPFPVGDAAAELPVFDGFRAVFQFWEGDDEFPASIRFLWDASALQYLHYETLYYIMGCLLERLAARL